MYENSKSLITITEELFSEFQQIKTNNYNYSRILSKTKELETYIVHKKWIYRQLREPGSLSISILLLLILAETSKMQPNNHYFLSVFWQLESWVETVCFAQSKNILNATHIEFLEQQTVKMKNAKPPYSASSSTKAKTCFMSLLNCFAHITSRYIIMTLPA